MAELWNSLSLLTLINLILQWIAGIFAFIAALATIVTILINSRIGILQEASAKVGKLRLEKQIEDSNLKTADAKRRAEELEKRLSPWVINAQQKSALIENLQHIKKGKLVFPTFIRMKGGFIPLLMY